MKRVQSTLSVAMWLLVSVMICGSAAVFTSCGENTLEEILGAIDNPSGSTVAVTGITLNKASLRLYMNNTETMPGSVLLTAAVYPDNATDQSVTWSSSDESKATVDETGKVTAVAKGTLTITAKAGDQQATCEITIGRGVDLSTVTTDSEFEDYDELTGTLGTKVKISIADGATVTLRDVDLNGYGALDWANYAGITCIGDATIILKGTNSVRGFGSYHPGIFIPSGKTLTIQGADTDKLTAAPKDVNDGDCKGAGIGGGYDMSCGNIVIEGGDITAKGGNFAAGIGGGGLGHCGSITISGGKVNARGGNCGAGIGCSRRGNCGDITISGGTVEAYGGYEGAGIGGAFNDGFACQCGNIIIRGDNTKVTAVGGSGSAGIGSGSINGSTSSCGTITIYGGTVEATGGTEGAGIGSGRGGECGKITISGGVVKASSARNGAGIGCGLIGVCGDIEISGDNTKVTAVGGSGGAGIGSGQSEYLKDSRCGHITILGGTVDAKGGEQSAGIGTGYASGATSSCGNINITSGVTSVTATKGSDDVKSIGQGLSGDCGTVTIEDEEKVTQN